MSRVGKLPVALPQGVKISVSADSFTVEGPKGKLVQSYIPQVEIKVDGKEAVVTRKNDSKEARSLHGLYRNLLNNMVIGVSQGYTKGLVISGVGYRAELKGKSLLLNLGYSTQMEYLVPQGITIAVENQTKISVSGIDKAQVGQVAAEIRSIRPPEPYKGKGIKYDTEVIRRKVGKSGIK
jgi:large subunit ribosomal protein L6